MLVHLLEAHRLVVDSDIVDRPGKEIIARPTGVAPDAPVTAVRLSERRVCALPYPDPIYVQLHSRRPEIGYDVMPLSIIKP